MENIPAPLLCHGELLTKILHPFCPFNKQLSYIKRNHPREKKILSSQTTTTTKKKKKKKELKSTQCELKENERRSKRNRLFLFGKKKIRKRVLVCFV